MACWVEDVDIATYEPAAPDEFPMFFDQRVYQGSDGRIYPLPFVDSIARQPVVRPWRAVHLENRWIRLMLLPDLGGRIHIGYDKTRDYDFLYRNNVIKPALVGVGGPWISGGVEFNWPQHHRPGTYLPMEIEIERSDDGSVTVWHADLDPMQRMRGTHGVRLRPSEASIEVAARLHNRTEEPQTFLWWANVAAAAHEDYQAFFPTDVTHVADHARRAITAFPGADRPYYGVDYPALAAERPGADQIDRYSSILVPTSYMVTDTQDEFFGGYDHRAGAGFVHWAERDIAPGKKQWTWGDGEIGRAWDRQLTDDDGPYVELMAGVFTDNQPDFSYLAPGETRTFSQFWYPIQDIGIVHQASREAALSVEVDSGRGRVGLSVVRAARVRVRVLHDGDVVHDHEVDVAPGQPYLGEFEVPGAATRADVVVEATERTESAEPTEPTEPTADDRLLVAWQAHPVTDVEPWLATAPPLPEDITAVDELLLTAQHLIQYRHPSRSPRPYLERVLAIDAQDSRAHLALAELDHGVGRYDQAMEHLDAAAARITHRNLNPRTGDLHYRRGLTLERLGRRADAAAAFVKATWDAAFAVAGRLGAARISLLDGDAAVALAHLDQAVAIDGHNPTARALRVLALRRLGEEDTADRALQEALAADPLDPLLRAVDGSFETADSTAYLTIAHELTRVGEHDLAVEWADRAITAGASVFGNPGPVAHYLRARIHAERGDHEAAAREIRYAGAVDRRYAFPAGLDDLDVLTWACGQGEAETGRDRTALGLLGSLLMGARRTEDARIVLVEAVDAGSRDPVVLRNAAIAVVNTMGDLEVADGYLETAIATVGPLGRLVFERDQLARLRGLGSAQRLSDLEGSGCDLLERDDLTIAYLGLLLDVDRVEEAMTILETREFQPFEGGEGKVIAAFDRASIAASALLLASDPRAAAQLLDAGTTTPLNLGEGRHPGDPQAARLVAAGDAHAAAGDLVTAASRWRQARDGGGVHAVDPRPARQDDFWIGLAHCRLGELAAASRVWAALEETADALERAPMAPDYFATSLPEMLVFSVEDRVGRQREVDALRTAATAGRALQALSSEDAR